SLSCDLRSLVAILRVKQPWTEGLMQFRTDERQPFLQTIVFQTVRPGRQHRFGFPVCQIQEDGNAFGQNLTVVEFENWHYPLWADLLEIASVFDAVRLASDIDPHEIEGNAGFDCCNMGCHRTDARRVVEFHSTYSCCRRVRAVIRI